MITNSSIFFLLFSFSSYSQNISNTMTALDTRTRSITIDGLRRVANIQSHLSAHKAQVEDVQKKYARLIGLINGNLSLAANSRQGPQQDKVINDIHRQLKAAYDIRSKTVNMRDKLKLTLNKTPPASKNRPLAEKINSWPKFEDILKTKSKSPLAKNVVDQFNKLMKEHSKITERRRTKVVTMNMKGLINKTIQRMKITNPTVKGSTSFP